MPAPSINPTFLSQSPPQQQQQQQRKPPPPLQTTVAHPTSLTPLSTTTGPSPGENKTEQEKEPGSPVAPEYSPITPKIQPVLPATIHQPPVSEGVSLSHDNAAPNNTSESAFPPQQQQQRSQSTEGPYSTPMNPSTAPSASSLPESSATATAAQYIPEPRPQPFSSADSTDAIALRAAISSLQFQKKKAQDDLLALDKLRGQALEDPDTFRRELEGGRVHERRNLSFEDWKSALLEAEESSGEDGNDGAEGKEEEQEGPHVKEEKGEQEVNKQPIDSFLSKDDVDMDGQQRKTKDNPPNGDSQASSRPKSKSSSPTAPNPAFDSIPGPQNVVRMPYVNWEKYHLSGASLERLHAVQQRWPGTSLGYENSAGGARGREHVVAAPYSPWLDSLESGAAGGEGGLGGGAVQTKRSDSLGVVVTPSSVSEHPMATRRASRMH